MFDRMPKDIALTMFGFLSPFQNIQRQSVSKGWSLWLKNDLLWQQNGATSFKDFVNSVNITLTYRELKNLVLDGVYSLAFAKDINRLCRLNVVARQRELLADDEVNLIPQHYRISYLDAALSVPYGIMAWKEKLVTAVQIANMKNDGYIKSLFTSNGLRALRNGLITPEIFNEIISVARCDNVLTEYGIIALENKWISIEQINKFDQPRCISVLLSPKGLKALEEGILTPDEAAKTGRSTILKVLLEEDGMTALKLKLISVEKADSFFNVLELKNYITHLVAQVKPDGSGPKVSNTMRII